MAIDFPDSPTNGQEFQGYYWDNSKQAWRSQSTNRGSVITSSTTPTGATSGDLWFNAVDGTMYVYYDDGITAQWVEIQANVDNYKTPSQNYIINGGFDIWQRGIGPVSAGNGGYAAADRWYIYNNATQTTTVAQETSVVPFGFRSSIKITQTGTSTTPYIMQSIETLNAKYLAGKTVTLSAYVYGAVSTSFGIGVRADPSVDKTPATGYSSSPVTGSATVGPVWTRITATGVVPDNTNTIRIDVFANSPTLGQPFYIAGVQLEEGTIATPFRRNQPNIQAELAACQRYYAQVGSLSAVLTNAGFASTDSVLASGNFTFPVPTRTSSPTITVFDIVGTSGRMHRQFVGSGGGSNVAVSITQINQYGFYVTSNIGNTDRAGKYYGYYTVSNEL